MKIPETCPHCGAKIKENFEDVEGMYWVERTELNYDSDFLSRIEDQVWECGNCHTLFRVRWELKSFTELVEKVS